MSYPCTAFEVLISSPSDVTTDTLATIRHAIARWNAQMGKATSTVVIPVAWGEDAVAEFGGRPQGLINDQLTDRADACLAIFRDKLGSPTGEAVSGTWEEIERLDAAGKPVGILRDASARPAATGTSDVEELLRLNKHMEEHTYSRALVLPFTDKAELQDHISQFLTRFTSQAERTAEHERTTLPAETDPALGVWPRIESSEYIETDSKGRTKTRRRHELVLSNQTGRPVHDVYFEFDLAPDEVFDVIGGRNSEHLKTMPPAGEARFPLAFVLGSASQAECLAHWTDDDSEHVTQATVTV